MARTIADRIKARRLPAVDAPEVEDQSVRQFIEGVKEHLRMYEGDSGAPKERFVTIEELETVGLITTDIKQGFALISGTDGAAFGASAVSSGSGVTTLHALTDTAVAGAEALSYLQYDGARWRAALPSLVELTDTGMNGQGTWDMLYNAGGNIWKPTAGLLTWDTTKLKLANNLPISWENSSDVAIELLKMSPVGGFNPEPDVIIPEVDDITYDSTSPEFTIAEHQAMCFNADGTILYTCGLASKFIRGFVVGTAFDVTTVSPTQFEVSTVALNSGATEYVKHIQWSGDGLTLFYTDYVNGKMHTHTVSTPYTLADLTGVPTSISNFTGVNITAFDFSQQGSYVTIGYNGNRFISYSLTTPYDITTGVVVGTELAIAGGTKYEGVLIQDDGLRVIFLSTLSAFTPGLRQYTLTTAFDMSTATYDTQYLAITSPTNSTALWLEPTAGAIFVGLYGAGGNTDCVIQRFEYTGGSITYPNDKFTVGDPAYPAFIDGTQIDNNADTHLTSGSELVLWDAANTYSWTTRHLGTEVEHVSSGTSQSVHWRGANDLPGNWVFHGNAALGHIRQQSEEDVTKYIEMYHNTTTLAWLQTTHDLMFYGATGAVNIHYSNELRHLGGAGVQWVAHSHDGADFTTHFELNPLNRAQWFIDSVNEIVYDNDMHLTWLTADTPVQKDLVVLNSGDKILSLQTSQFGTVAWGDHADLTMGAGDFTMEAWIRFETTPSVSAGVWLSKYDAASNKEWIWRYGTGGVIEFTYSTTGANDIVGFSASWAPAANVWYLVTVVRDSTDMMMWVNGVRMGSVDTTIAANTIFDSASVLRTGGYKNIGILGEMPGQTSNVRITKGVVRYPTNSNFDPDLVVPGPFPTDAIGDSDWANVSFLALFDGSEGQTTYTSDDTNAFVGVFTNSPTLEFDTSPWSSENIFVLGDPTIPTRIDGLTVSLNGQQTIITPVAITAYTATILDDVVAVDDDTAGATVTITLPTVATATKPVHIKKLGTTANVIVDGDTAETIDGAATAVLTSQYESIMLVSDGITWHVI